MYDSVFQKTGTATSFDAEIPAKSYRKISSQPWFQLYIYNQALYSLAWVWPCETKRYRTPRYIGGRLQLALTVYITYFITVTATAASRWMLLVSAPTFILIMEG